MRPLRVFIIQPFGQHHSNDFRAAVDEVCSGSRGQFFSFRADGEFSQFPRLQDRIDSHIKGADVCVADLSEPRNSNVLLEVGAAYALAIPVIPVSDTELPEDIRGNLRIDFKSESVVDRDARTKFMSDLGKRLNESRAEIGRHYGDQFVSYGYHTRRNVDFHSLVQRCEKRISILTTNLGFLMNETMPVLDDGATSGGGVSGSPDPEFAGMQEMSLLEMITKFMGAKPDHFVIKILSLDPDSNFTNDRASALDRDKTEFRDAMRRDLERLRLFTESDKCKRTVQIKLYDESPLQMTYFFDDDVIASVVAKGISSRECVTYGHSLWVHGARETYERHFDNLWGTARLFASGGEKDYAGTDWRSTPTRARGEANPGTPVQGR